MRSKTAILVLVLCSGCGSRSELGIDDELDGSLADVWQDGSAEDVTVDVTLDAPPPPDASDGSVEDGAVDAGVDGGPECVPDCTHNFQCEVTCPPLSTGRWCCDEQTNTCYAFAGKHCPNPIFDAGFD